MDFGILTMVLTWMQVHPRLPERRACLGGIDEYWGGRGVGVGILSTPEHQTGPIEAAFFQIGHTRKFLPVFYTKSSRKQF